MPQSLIKRAAELELQVKERAETVKQVLREYRETARGNETRRRNSRTTLQRKKLKVERANAEYLALQKELDLLRAKLQARK